MRPLPSVLDIAQNLSNLVSLHIYCIIYNIIMGLIEIFKIGYLLPRKLFMNIYFGENYFVSLK